MSEVAVTLPESAEIKTNNPASAEAKAEPVNRIAELRVSGNLMTLDAGLFCVFQAPGSPSPDPSTGLPGVRVSLAPGALGRPDAVSISTFRPDGWLDGTGALVRVKDGTAQILVTIYQGAAQTAETAPRLQVLRLSGDAPRPAPQAAAAPSAPPAPQEDPDILAHVQRLGDVGCKFGGWIGTRGSRLWMEGFGISPQSGIAAEDIEYQGVLGRGWLSPWVQGGKFCGSRGMALPLLGFRLRLKGNAAKAYSCTYSATFVDGSAVGPLPAGETCESESLAALEAFQIELRPREARQGVSKTTKAKAPAKAARR
jgi:Clostridial hydrophobic W